MQRRAKLSANPDTNLGQSIWRRTVMHSMPRSPLTRAGIGWTFSAPWRSRTSR